MTTQNPYDSGVNAFLPLFEVTETALPDVRPWDLFKSGIDSLLIALKYAPHRTKDALGAIDKLIRRIYNEDFLDNRSLSTLTHVSHNEIRGFLLDKTDRFVQILPGGQEGSDLMQRIVTLLTMTSDQSAHAQYNEWATQIVIRVASGRQ